MVVMRGSWPLNGARMQTGALVPTVSEALAVQAPSHPFAHRLVQASSLRSIPRLQGQWEFSDKWQLQETC